MRSFRCWEFFYQKQLPQNWFTVSSLDELESGFASPNMSNVIKIKRTKEFFKNYWPINLQEVFLGTEQKLCLALWNLLGVQNQKNMSWLKMNTLFENDRKESLFIEIFYEKYIL